MLPLNLYTHIPKILYLILSYEILKRLFYWVPLELHPQGGKNFIGPAGGSNPAGP